LNENGITSTDDYYIVESDMWCVTLYYKEPLVCDVINVLP
jgi:hypothetical protein